MSAVHAKAEALIDRANEHLSSNNFRPYIDLDEHFRAFAVAVAEELLRLERHLPEAIAEEQAP